MRSRGLVVAVVDPQLRAAVGVAEPEEAGVIRPSPNAAEAALVATYCCMVRAGLSVG